MRVKVREKRQVTLPAELLDALGIKPGDSFEANVEGDVLVMKPSKKAAMDALKEIRKVFKESGISLDEMIESGRQIRAQIAHEKWPDLYPPVDKRE
ncbi:MAG TPA: AbrB/MazE/SpoVT family DNA-binding domain-containing protein [Dehalococcoidia bacterium]|nr:AbrB/MazE/SpoVT family DNA-binding domain-containing protein [Dehalococcoidia bacterium]